MLECAVEKIVKTLPIVCVLSKSVECLGSVPKYTSLRRVASSFSRLRRFWSKRAIDGKAHAEHLCVRESASVSAAVSPTTAVSPMTAAAIFMLASDACRLSIKRSVPVFKWNCESNSIIINIIELRKYSYASKLTFTQFSSELGRVFLKSNWLHTQGATAYRIFLKNCSPQKRRQGRTGNVPLQNPENLQKV